jgi:hypothetical protein
MTKIKRLVRYLLKKKRLTRLIAILVGVFVVVNLAVLIIYWGRTYPKTFVAGQHIGSSKYDQSPARVEALSAFPKTISINYDGKTNQFKPKDLGLSLDKNKLIKQAHIKPWLPVVGLLTKHTIPLPTTVWEPVLQQRLSELAATYKKSPVDARVVLKAGVFTQASAVKGVEIDAVQARKDLLAAISAGKPSITLPTKVVQPKITDAQVAEQVKTLQAQQGVGLTYKYNSKTQKASSQDITGWFVESLPGYQVSDANIKSYLVRLGVSWGISVKNIPDVIASTKDALNKKQPTTIAIIGEPLPIAVKAFSYCGATRGVDASNVPALKAKLAATYQDGRGWSLGGQVSYSEVASGCSFTVWLAASDQMASFGSICDAVWSCTVSPNVIINFDRWRYASDSWNKSGGNLEDYRSMVINHETGHWLGFGHSLCGGAGQLAPVMQQQSIDLQNCAFNPWPLASEQAQLKQRLGI